jgi:hypothetical protein
VLVASAVGRSARDHGPSSALVVAAFEQDPETWANLDWRFAESGKPVPLDRPDADGVRWRLVTFREFLSTYARHPIPEMLAPGGSPCGPFTRGVLRRRPTRDGEQWLILKEAAVWGDDPPHAFSAPQPERIRANRTSASADWDKIAPALGVVGPSAVAREMGLAERSARAWAARTRQPENPGEVARAIVDVAHGAGLGLPKDGHLRAEEICGELPCRAAAVQAFIATTAAMLAERHGGVRALARALAGEGGRDCEPAVRRWLALARSEPRSITELNRIVARLGKFSRSEIRKSHRRIRSEPGAVGDRQAVLARISQLCGAERPVVPTLEETLALPAVVMAVLLTAIAWPIAEALRNKVHPQSSPRAVFASTH